MKVYAFVGPSGTGKSYRAQMVAAKYEIKYIIDDGLLITKNDIAAGVSAKKASTKIETIRQALFIEDKKRKEMIKYIKNNKIESILILGTSDKMVETIANNLKLPKISETIYIQDVATNKEIEEAKYTRMNEGKHVIPVPTFKIKKDFSGMLLDSLQIFKIRNGEQIERSIIRPTFSYIGNFEISDNVFKQIIEYISRKTKIIEKILKIKINKDEEDPSIYVEVEILFNANFVNELENFRKECIKEIEEQTTMNVKNMKVVAKKIKI